VDSIPPKISADLATKLGGFGRAALSADVAPMLEEFSATLARDLATSF
jgi:hypothetical protein